MGDNVRGKLLGLGLLPETFVQKWFAGITIHHLPYHLLMPFLDNFFANGNHYLFQFFLAFFDEFEADVMKAAANPELNALIRFETAPEPRLEKIIHNAASPQYQDSTANLDLHKLRIVGF